ncbi:hypothetical protein [Sphingomonas sp. KC8]|uniref:hypothetical protein n=1 Tax=Sphingomonas sp. KC8 TaxID=1030157 RepID=UPI000248A3D4|nr:hypothetical protein [Sphingomonas sp. KC8]ARS29155.1 hypothetical protein KC8_17940 [Sphingomonas sp. KC8]
MAGRTATALALLLALAACGEKETASGTITGEDGKKATYQVTEKDGQSTLTVKTEDGNAQIVSGAGEAALPPGLALYPGATITNSTRITGETPEKGGSILAFDTQDAPAKVVAFYKAAALKAGYTIEGEVKMGEMEMLTAKNSGKAGFTLTANQDAGKTSASLLSGAGTN